MSNNDKLNESNFYNKSIETTQSKEPKNYKKSAAYKFAVGVLALSITVGSLTGCGGDKINATEPTPTQVEDYTETDSTNETSDEGSEVATSEVTSESTTSTPASTVESTTSIENTPETTTAEVISTEQNFDSMYTFKYELPTADNRIVPSRFSNGELVDYSVPRTYSAEDYNFKYLSPEQQTEIKNMADMSVEDFRALPQEDQLTYAFWLFENNYQSFELMLDIIKVDRDYNWKVSDAYELINNYACSEIFWRTLISYKNPSGDQYDFDAMKKFGSLLYSPDLLDDHDGYIEQIKANGGSTPDDLKVRLTEADYVDPNNLPRLDNVELIPISATFESSKLVTGDSLTFLDFEKVKFTTITGEDAYAFIMKKVIVRN